MDMATIQDGINYAFRAASQTNIELVIPALTTIFITIISLLKLFFIRNARLCFTVKILFHIAIYISAFTLLFFFAQHVIVVQTLLALFVFPMLISLIDLIISYQRTGINDETSQSQVPRLGRKLLSVSIKSAIIVALIFVMISIQTLILYWPREIDYYWTRFPAPIAEVFPDPVLARHIASTLGRGNRTHSHVTLYDLERITSFTAMDGFPSSWIELAPGIDGLRGGLGGITDLEGMQYLTSLRYLALVGHSQLSDISSLAELSNLTQLVLTNNNVSDLVPLKNLAGLEWLCLIHNFIYDISPLAGLYQLNYLALGNHSHEFYVIGGRASNRIYLEPIQRKNPLVLQSIIIGINGETISPTGVSRGIYDSPYLIWADLSEDQTSVIYTFSVDVSVGNATTTFSGRVSQPLVPSQ